MAMLPNEWFKSSPITIFINEIYVISSFENFDELDNMGCIVNFGECLDLIDCEFFKSRTYSVLIDSDNLNGDNLVGFFIDRFIDLTEFSFSYHSFKAIVLDFLTHQLEL